MSADRELQPVLNMYRGFSRITTIDDVREFKRDKRRELGLSPQGFVAADQPIGAKMVHRQAEDYKRLAEIASAEDSALPEDAWVDLVTPLESLDENIQTLLNEGGALPAEERQRQQAQAYEDAVDAAEKDAYNYLLEIGREIAQETDADPVSAMGTALSGTAPRIGTITPDRGQGRSRTLDGEGVRDVLTDMADEFGDGFVRGAIDDIDASTSATQRDNFYDAVADVLEEVTGTPPSGPDNALETIRSLSRQAREQERDEILERLSLAFGSRFSDVDGVIDTLTDRLERARGEAVQTADIVVEKRPGETATLTVDGPDVFDTFADDLIAQAQSQLPLADLELNNYDRVVVGEATVVGSRLEDVSFERGEVALEQRTEQAVDTEAEAVSVDRPVAEQFADDLLSED